MKNFWQKLNKPILVSAPMSGVTDAAFRKILAKYGKPDVIFTEFVSVDGLCSEGRDELLRTLIFDNSERPVVAQLFGRNPEHFYQSAKICKTLGFDGIDINMGCPDKDVIKQGAGASLILEPALAKEVILATKKGAKDLPVSVKTRIGFDKILTETWIANLLECDLAVLTIHGRTKNQGYQGEVHWEEIAKAKKIAQDMDVKTLIFGNGDVKSLDDAYSKAKEYDLDGIMIGRALLANPLFFNKTKQVHDLSTEEKFSMLIEYAKLFEEIFKGKKNFSEMKKFYKSYTHGIKQGAKLRMEMMEAKNSEELFLTLQRYDLTTKFLD